MEIIFTKDEIDDFHNNRFKHQDDVFNYCKVNYNFQNLARTITYLIMDKFSDDLEQKITVELQLPSVNYDIALNLHSSKNSFKFSIKKEILNKTVPEILDSIYLNEIFFNKLESTCSIIKYAKYLDKIFSLNESASIFENIKKLGINYNSQSFRTVKNSTFIFNNEFLKIKVDKFYFEFYFVKENYYQLKISYENQQMNFNSTEDNFFDYEFLLNAINLIFKITKHGAPDRFIKNIYLEDLINY